MALWRGLWTIFLKITRGSDSPAHLEESNTAKRTKFKEKTEHSLYERKNKRKFVLVLLIRRVEARKMEIPNAKRGGAIVDNDGSGGGKVIEIRLSLYFRYERHVYESRS